MLGFEQMAEAAPNPLLVLDSQQRIFFANGAATKAFGYTSAELVGEGIDRLLVRRTDRAAVGRRKDGTEVPLEVSLTPVADASGSFWLAWITERAPRFQVLAESLPQMVWMCRGDGPCEYLSPQWVAYTGVPEAEQLGYRWLEQLHPDDVEPTKARWAAAAASGEPFDTVFRIRRFDGTYRSFKTRAIAIRNAAGAIDSWIGSNTDIQDMLDAQEAVVRLNRELEARDSTRTMALRDANAKLGTVAAQLQTAQRITRVGSWELEVATGSVSWSEELFRVFDLPQGEAPEYARQAELFEPASWSRLRTAIENSIATGEGYELTLSIVTRTGAKRTAIARAEVLRGEDGRVARLAGTFQDITDREESAVMVRLLHERLRLATSATRMGVWDWNISTNELVWDERMYQLYGVRPDEFSGAYDAWKSALLDEDRAAAEQALWDGVANVRPFRTSFRIRHADGIRYIRAEATVDRDPTTGEAMRMVGVNWDVTQQRLSEAALERSETLMRAILTHAGAAVIATDLDGTITVFNHAAEELLGYRAAEMIGVSTPSVFHEPVEVERRRVALQQELGVEITNPFDVFVIRSRLHGPDINEWTYIRKDGVRVPVLLTVSSIKDDEKRLIGYLGVAVDLGQRKKTERELMDLNALLAQRSAQREILLQEVHHRVKNNLQVISSLVNMHLRQVADAAARTTLADMQNRVQAIAMIHEQLYSEDQYDSVRFRDYALRLSTNILRTATETSRIALTHAMENVLFPVSKAIPCGLILNELVVNAVKHAFPDHRAGCIHIELSCVGNEAILVVSDDGRGFTVGTDKRESLGMRLIATLARQLEGTTSLESSSSGTTFRVRFPLGDEGSG